MFRTRDPSELLCERDGPSTWPGGGVTVKLIAVDEKTGKLKLSRKVLLPKPESQA